MIKTFLILLNLQLMLVASQQVVLVVSENFSSSDAKLECYEDGKKVFKAIDVKIGKNGLGWGLGEITLSKKKEQPSKVEGDKKAPIGVFRLSNVFGYNYYNNLKMPYLYASKNLICVDDSSSPFYNHVIEALGDEKSFEYMRRKDHQYELGIVVEHNKNGVENRGSCIFMHIKKSADSPTAGCTAMEKEDIEKIAYWLDKSKNPLLIQISKSQSKEILELYPELKSSKLLQED